MKRIETRFDRQQQQAIAAEYTAGAELQELMAKYDFSWKGITRILKNCDVPKRPKGGRKNASLYSFDEMFFQRPNDPIVAYWSGFLYADGNIDIQENTDSLKVDLSQKDLEHGKLFCQHTQNTMPLFLHNGFHSTQGMFRIRFNRKGLAADLKPWGIVPNKSKIWVKPTIEKSVLPDYLRGWFDGDGYVKTTRQKEVFRITGNQEGIKFYADSLRNLGYDGHIGIEQTNGSFKATISGRLQVLRVLRLIDGNPRLDRKWETQVILESAVDQRFGKPPIDHNLQRNEKGQFIARPTSESTKLRH